MHRQEEPYVDLASWEYLDKDGRIQGRLTDAELAKLLEILDWTQSIFVFWATSTGGRPAWVSLCTPKRNVRPTLLLLFLILFLLPGTLSHAESGIRLL